MMKKSEILVEEDGTLAVFPETFEEHKEELQSDIKAEEPWSPTFQLAKGKIILDVGSAVRTQLFCRILESQHGQAGQQSNIRMTFIYTSSGGESGGGDERETKTEQKEQNQERKKRRRTEKEKRKEMEEKKHKRKKRNREEKGR
ncbi:hypothetical protein NC651_034791 [Populus alba x Populus x berolinensis]|nr:hypothetical protein NC651_034791 [Populus alba x Populus x berolinensis]